MYHLTEKKDIALLLKYGISLRQFALNSGYKNKRKYPVKIGARLLVAYTYFHIKERWPSVEKYIMKYPRCAYDYARYIIKGRWPEAEKVIMQNTDIATLYENFLTKNNLI